MFAANPLCAPGRFANSRDCVRCELCINHAPQIFALDPAGKAYVHHQPQSPEELKKARTCLENCPISGIVENHEG